jgi:penicillin-binding protein 2
LPGEAAGLVPSTRWKLRTFRQKWFAGETISVSIGQGPITATPLQLANAIGGLALGGIWRRPHLVHDEDNTAPPRVASFNVRHAVQIVNGMWAVVNEQGGTGIRAHLPGIDVCGKTGTAQLVSNAVRARMDLGDTLKDNAWFVGFAPRQNPEIVVVVLWEGGEHGSYSAPIARDVIKAYFDKKTRRDQSRPLLSRAQRPASIGNSGEESP